MVARSAPVLDEVEGIGQSQNAPLHLLNALQVVSVHDLCHESVKAIRVNVVLVEPRKLPRFPVGNAQQLHDEP